MREYDVIDDVKSGLFRHFELFYNRRRYHSVLGYDSPATYRKKYDAGEAAQP